MSAENIDVARRVVEATHLGPAHETVERAVEWCDPEVEFVSRLSTVEGGTYNGHDGIRRYFADMAEVWEEWRTWPDGLEEIRPGTVLATLVTHAVGKSGAGGELRTFAVIAIVDGKVRRIDSYPSRADALEAAGIEE
jgi:hypothetical protein